MVDLRGLRLAKSLSCACLFRESFLLLGLAQRMARGVLGAKSKAHHSELLDRPDLCFRQLQSAHGKIMGLIKPFKQVLPIEAAQGNVSGF